MRSSPSRRLRHGEALVPSARRRCPSPAIPFALRHEDDARAVARPDEAVLGAGRAMHEVPRFERPLLALDQQKALAGEDEEVLLVGLTVIPPARLTRLEYGEREADVGEGCVVALEDAGGAERLVRHPRSIRDADDEPAVAHGREAGFQLLEACFLDHVCSLLASAG